MQKLLVVDAAEKSRVPFLRGILTRSLQDAGLPFEASYQVATKVREELCDVAEITTEQLRARVAAHVQQFGSAIQHRYAVPFAPTPTIMVRCGEGSLTPYSRGRNRASLEACGFASEESASIAQGLHDHLVARGVEEIDLPELRRLCHRFLTEALGEDAGRRYLVWQAFRQSSRPLIVLIGGTAGSGKSTLATQIAHLLEIVRIQSTDMLREVMRVLIPERLLPVLHTSSFKAWQKLPTRAVALPDGGRHSPIEDGYLIQAELLGVACEAVIQRAVHERVSLILEGVHVQPGLLRRLPAGTDAIVVPLMLAVLKPTELRARVRGRGKRHPDRRAKRYLEHFDDLWRLQSFLLSEADRTGVPIVANDTKEKTIREMLGTIHDGLARTFTGEPEEVLG